MVLLYDLFWNSFIFKQFLNYQKGFPLISGIFAKTYMSIVMLHCIYLYQPNLTGKCFLVCNKVLFTRDIIYAWQFITVCTLNFHRFYFSVVTCKWSFRQWMNARAEISPVMKYWKIENIFFSMKRSRHVKIYQETHCKVWFCTWFKLELYQAILI